MSGQDPELALDPLEVAKASLFIVLQSAAPIGPAPQLPRDLVGSSPGSSSELRHLGPFGDVAFLARRRNKTPHSSLASTSIRFHNCTHTQPPVYPFSWAMGRA